MDVTFSLPTDFNFRDWKSLKVENKLAFVALPSLLQRGRGTAGKRVGAVVLKNVVYGTGSQLASLRRAS